MLRGALLERHDDRNLDSCFESKFYLLFVGKGAYSKHIQCKSTLFLPYVMKKLVLYHVDEDSENDRDYAFGLSLEGALTSRYLYSQEWKWEFDAINDH